MEDLFQMLSQSARIDKSRRKRPNTSKHRETFPPTAASDEKNANEASPKAQQQQQQQKDLGKGIHEGHTQNDDDNDDDNDEDSLVSSSSRESEGSQPQQQQQQQQQEGKSRDKTGKRDLSVSKQEQIHREQIAAFRRSMAIRIHSGNNSRRSSSSSNHDDPDLPDPMTSFQELMDSPPVWWCENNKSANNDSEQSFLLLLNYRNIVRVLLRNIEAGKWNEPTPIQMQSVPVLLQNRRDLIGAAPTGSGKSGAFLVPAVLLASAPDSVYYGGGGGGSGNTTSAHQITTTAAPINVKMTQAEKRKLPSRQNRRGEIRTLILAPSLELAAQLHREVERLGVGIAGGFHPFLLSKSNAAQIIAGTAGGNSGIDVLVATPLRLVDAVEKGLRLDHVRMVVLDEADRLLDATDHSLDKSQQSTNQSKDTKKQQQKTKNPKKKKTKNSERNDQESSSSEEDSSQEEVHDDDDAVEEESGKEDVDDSKPAAAVSASSGSTHSRSFLVQMDTILASLPVSAIRALFSATVTDRVRHLAESMLRNPVDISVGGVAAGGANPDIEQRLTFVGREEGKLLAIRQLVQRAGDDWTPPILIFLESQSRAQALFEELLYDGIHVDVIHAGRSKAARERAVAKFRKGETWVLIATDLVARGVDFRAVNTVINYDLPASGITYVHRIGRTGRAGRKGRAITFFTEADMDQLRTIANIMKQSGCKVEDWMLRLKKKSNRHSDKTSSRTKRYGRRTIDTTPKYDKLKKRKKQQMIQNSKRKKNRADEDDADHK